MKNEAVGVTIEERRLKVVTIGADGEGGRSWLQVAGWMHARPWLAADGWRLCSLVQRVSHFPCPGRSALTAPYVSGISRHLLHSAHVLLIPCPAVVFPCRPGGLLPGCAAACARGARGEPLPSAGHQDRDQDEEGSARNAVARSGGGRSCSRCSRQPRAGGASTSGGGSSRGGRGGASAGGAFASVPVCRVRSRWRLLLLPPVWLPLLHCCTAEGAPCRLPGAWLHAACL